MFQDVRMLQICVGNTKELNFSTKWECSQMYKHFKSRYDFVQLMIFLCFGVLSLKVTTLKVSYYYA